MKYKQRMLGVTTLALAMATTVPALAQVPSGVSADAPTGANAAPHSATPRGDAGPIAPTPKDALTDKSVSQAKSDPQNVAGVPPAPPASVVTTGALKGRTYPRRTQLEQNLRGQMAAFGFAGEDTQNALIAYIRKEEHSRWPLKQSAKRMAQCLNAGATPIPDDQIRAAVTDFRNELEKDRVRRQQAEVALDAKIGYSQNARLEAMLILFGMVGDTQVVMIPSPPLPAQPPTGVTASMPPANALPVPPLPIVPANAPAAPLLAMSPHGAIPLNTMPMPLTTPGASAVLSLKLRTMGGGNPGQGRGLRRDDFFTGELRQELLRRFDKNNDHRLDAAERAEALAYLTGALSLKDSATAPDTETKASTLSVPLGVTPPAQANAGNASQTGTR